MANCRLCHPLTSFVGLSLHMLDVDFDKLATWYAMLDDLSVFLGPAPGVFNHLLSKKFKRAFWPYHFQSYLMQACVHRTLSKFFDVIPEVFLFQLALRNSSFRVRRGLFAFKPILHFCFDYVEIAAGLQEHVFELGSSGVKKNICMDMYGSMNGWTTLASKINSWHACMIVLQATLGCITLIHLANLFAASLHIFSIPPDPT